MDELRRSPTVPKDMAIAPTLGPIRPSRAVQHRTALLRKSVLREGSARQLR